MTAPGFVYAIESGDAVKIGFAKDPARRLSELNVGSPHVHRLIGFIEGDKQRERGIQRALASAKIRGEWFRKSDDVQSFLSSLTPYLQPEVKARGAERGRPNPREIGETERLLTSHFHALADGFLSVGLIASSTMWMRAVGDARFLTRIDSGASFTPRTYDKAVRWFSANWPDGVEWPRGVERMMTERLAA